MKKLILKTEAVKVLGDSELVRAVGACGPTQLPMVRLGVNQKLPDVIRGNAPVARALPLIVFRRKENFA